LIEVNKIHNMNCIDGLNEMIEQDLKVDLFVTSPPYYNAREYSQWETVNDYMNDMKIIFTKTYQCLKNHKYIVINVGDVSCQVGKAKRSAEKMKDVLNEKITKSKFEIEWETIQIKRNEEKLQEIERGNLDIYI